jgi:Uncharacterized protein conserved in bacteria (DUF2188)
MLLAQHATELHVLPHARTGGWLVAPSSGAAALSWHGTAGEAELAAQRHAAGRRAARIYLHDRYERVRSVPAVRAG